MPRSRACCFQSSTAERRRATRIPRPGLPQLLRTAIDAVLDLPISDPALGHAGASARAAAPFPTRAARRRERRPRQGTVLLIEDLHWVDRASDAVMAALASLKTPHLLIIVTSRPTGIPKWIDQCSAEIVALRPLDESSGQGDAGRHSGGLLHDVRPEGPDHPPYRQRSAVCRGGVPRAEGNRHPSRGMGQSHPRVSRSTNSASPTAYKG